MVYKKKVKKVRRHVGLAIAHVHSSFNNTQLTISCAEGDVLLQASAGKAGFKGSRKGTPFAATQMTTALTKDIMGMGIKQMEVNVKGPGAGKDPVVRALQSVGQTAGFLITVIRDVTPIAHNGRRQPGRRRV